MRLDGLKIDLSLLGQFRFGPIYANIFAWVSKGPKSKVPSSASYTTVLNAVNNAATPARLHVFGNMATTLFDFLKSFQTDNPMVPFLASALTVLLTNVLERFVKESVLSKHNTASTVTDIDCNDENIHLPLKSVKVGFAAKEALKSIQTEIKKTEFQSQCKSFYIAIVSKILE